MANIMISVVAFLHTGFLILEMFFWTKPLGLRIFGYSLEKAQASATLAANQGLYNGFLAAGLIWGVFLSDPTHSNQIKIFFLLCVIVAAVYGAITANPKIMLVQGLPAIIALVFVLTS